MEAKTFIVTQDTGRVVNSFAKFYVLNQEVLEVLLNQYPPEDVCRVLHLCKYVQDDTYVLKTEDKQNLSLSTMRGDFKLSRNIWSKFMHKMLVNHIIKIIVEGSSKVNSVVYRIVINPYLLNRGTVESNTILQFHDISKGLPQEEIPRDIRKLTSPKLLK